MPKRHTQRRHLRRFAILSALFVLSSFCLSLGMGLLLTKSPQIQSQQYLAMAHSYYKQAQDVPLQPQAQSYFMQQSVTLLQQALTYQPYDATLWAQYAQILNASSQVDIAAKAHNMAVSLGASKDTSKNFGDVSHGLSPSFLPSRHFALSESLPSTTIMR